MRSSLAVYPGPAARAGYLTVILMVNAAQYYDVYVHGAVSTLLIARFDMSLWFFVSISILGNLLGALASLTAGLGDRFGRVNLILGGLALSSALVLFVIPHVGSKGELLVWSVLASAVEGVVLSTTPALVRDFSPQLSRSTAMGLWALGPVLGNLAATEIASHTLPSHPHWQFQFYICGTVGLVAMLIAGATLRELSPELRNQVIGGTPRRAAAPTRTLAGFREMGTPGIVVPALAFGLYLFFYTSRVGFFVVYFATTFGYTAARANALDNWSWGFTAVFLVLGGVLGDRIGLRKPLIVAGTVIVLGTLVAWAVLATRPGTGYTTFVVVLAVAAFGGSMVTPNFMAAYSEALEARNPALVATGMAIWGWMVRVGVSIALAGVALLVPASGVLVDHGPEVSRIAKADAAQLATLQSIDPATRAALGADPTDASAQQAAVVDIMKATGLSAADAAAALQAAAAVPKADLAYLQQHGADVKQAVQDNPRQWRRWWWICLVGQLAFLPAIWLLPGSWRRRRDSGEPQQVGDLAVV